MKTIIRTAYDPSQDEGVKFLNPDGSPELSKTVQDQIDDCDINVIVSRFEKNGILPVTNVPPKFEDVSTPQEFQNSMNIVIQAENAFMQLPAKIRKEFDNSPLKFLENLENPEYTDLFTKVGIFEQKISPVKPDEKLPSTDGIEPPSE